MKMGWLVVGLLGLSLLGAGQDLADAADDSTYTQAEKSGREDRDSTKDDESVKGEAQSGETALGELGPSGGDTNAPVEEEKGLREMTLKEVVVTATRKEALVQDTPASVTIVDSKELLKSSLKTVDDVLRSVAGVDVWGSNLDPLGQRAVTVRGIGGGASQERTLILIDGVPVNDSWSGSVVWNQIAKEDIERIEVVRGPSSSLYGTNAMGGVINIITKLPQTRPVAGAVKGSYGELDTWYTYGNVSGRVRDGKYGYYLSARNGSSDGYVPFTDITPTTTKANYEMGNYLGQLVWFVDEHSYLRLTGNYLHEERNKGYEFSKLDPGEIKRGNLTYRRDVPGGLSLLGIVYGHGEEQTHENDNWTHTALDRISKYDKPFYGVILQPSYPLADWNILTVGAEYKRSEATQQDTYVTSVRETRTHGEQQYMGFYLQDEATFFGDRLLIIPGARYDWWESSNGSFNDTSLTSPIHTEFESRTWTSFNPKLGVVYHLDKQTNLRGSVGTGYRAPSPVELYASSRYSSTLVRGNPDLDPEQVLSYEIGGSRTMGSFLNVGLTLYRSEVDDLIDTQLLEVHGPSRIMQKANISRVVAQGVELEAFYKISRDWTGFANYTYNQSKIEEDEADPANVDNYLAFSPPNKVNFGLTYDNPKIITGTLQARWVDKSYDDNSNTTSLGSYWTLDIYLSRRLCKHALISFDIENLLDREYDIPSFNIYKAPGRLWAASLTVEF